MATSGVAGQADTDVKTDKKLRRKVIALAAAGAIGGFLFGFDSSVVNGAVDAIQDDFSLTAAFTGFAVASALLGCAVGAYLAGRLADRLGRIPVMLIGAVLFLVSSLGSGFAFAAWDLTVWRLIGGLGIGIASVIAPAYISEIAPKAIRGSLASLQQLAITVGIFTALLSDAVLANVAGGANEVFFLGLDAWRWMFLVCAVPAIVYGLVALRLPESPRFLLMTDKKEKATKVLASITPANQLDKAVADIEAGIREDAANADKSSLRGKRFGLLPIVWVGIILSMLQQLVGINVIFYYSTTLWSSVGFKESDSLTISVITSVTNVAVTFVAIFLVDKVGRRPILLFGSVGMAVALGSMTLAFSQAQLVDGKPSLEGAWGIIALIGANLFVVAFGASWGPLVWVLLGEIFPTRIRGRALGVAAAAQWLTNFAVTMTFPIISQDVSLTLAYGLYAAFAVLSFFFVFFKIPETKGVALEETGSLSVVRGRRREKDGVGGAK
ncbi:sugar porter family MFS transporter [Agreia sp. VKM Ac-1783]|uniref:sugar porter family MFS transporter n=1 Tax=Agreia sp. VKM Ac-1783 TaxID=1938889 RepID=UPI000A2AB889|nr:sugar porter family MFS transporter [Agreia sp. VKM Ac-1783]SMQ62524.1 MFS transporter, SP family, sugar:H+ symporter [Agreia sp. VKM Ac-1783]